MSDPGESFPVSELQYPLSEIMTMPPAAEGHCEDRGAGQRTYDEVGLEIAIAGIFCLDRVPRGSGVTQAWRDPKERR